MLDKLKSQFQSGRTFTRSDLHYVVDRSHFPKHFWNMYPMNQDYYHELNPFFVSTLYSENLLGSAQVYTCRDGMYDFATFFMNNYNFIKKNSFLFLIPEDFECMVPEALKDKFGTWRISQHQKVTPETAERVLFFGTLCEDYIGDLELLENRIQKLEKRIRCPRVDLVLPTRNNFIYQNNDSDAYGVRVTTILTKIFKDREIRVLSLEDFMKLTHLRNAYLDDLKADNFFVSDGFQNFLSASRGATVNLFEGDKPADSIFDLRLSFFHTLHVSPVNPKGTLFGDLLYLKKFRSNAGIFDKVRTHLRNQQGS